VWLSRFPAAEHAGCPAGTGPQGYVSWAHATAAADRRSAISNVYLAQHRMLKRPAAVKVLKQQATSDEWTARFQREVQLTSGSAPPHTIRIYDYGTGPGGEFLLCHGVSGRPVAGRSGRALRPGAARAHRLHPAPGLRFAVGSTPCGWCIAISAAEHHAVSDRGERDFVKVLDFGLVKQMSGDNTRDLTGSMRILGTPLYMSPERIRNPSDADGRADIYALGAVRFFLLTASGLFETETEHDLTYQVLHTVPKLASVCSPFAVPAELDALIGRCRRRTRRRGRRQ